MAPAFAEVYIDIDGQYRYIRSNGIADHATGDFPNRGNPNSISEQEHSFRVTMHPRKADSVTDIGHNSFGVALNGIPFDPATAEYWNNDRRLDWNIDALEGNRNLGLDANNAHVQPNGAYHYHGLPVGLLTHYDYKTRPALLGYAADGFPIYGPNGYGRADDAQSSIKQLRASYRVKSGTRPDGPGGRYDGTYIRDWEYIEGYGDLDACNGRFGVTPEYPLGIYYYVITSSFPSVPRCWVGSPDRSFFKGPHSGSGQEGSSRRSLRGSGRSGPPSPPAEAIAACRGSREGASCRFQSPHGTVQGMCRSLAGEIACAP